MEKVFISYAHEDGNHAANVLALADQLQNDGIEVVLDQYVGNPPEGWPIWMQKGLQEATHVLMICSPAYYRRVARQEQAGVGLGVQWEGNLLYNALYQNLNQGDKYIPVLLDGFSIADIPDPAQGFHRYTLHDPFASDTGYSDLYAHLTGQNLTPAPPLGTRKIIAPTPRRTPSNP